MDELEKLRAEKDKLLETQKVDTEKKKLEREIFLLKKPWFSFAGRAIKGTFNVAANIGDAVIRSMTKFLAPRPPAAQATTPTRKSAKKGKAKKGKAKVEEPPKPTGILDSLAKTMENIDKEMNKVDQF